MGIDGSLVVKETKTPCSRKQRRLLQDPFQPRDHHAQRPVILFPSSALASAHIYGVIPPPDKNRGFTPAPGHHRTHDP